MKKRIILTIDYKYQILVESGKITLKLPLTYFVGNVWVICNKIRMFLLLLNNLVFNSIVLIYKLSSSIRSIATFEIAQNCPKLSIVPPSLSFFCLVFFLILTQNYLENVIWYFVDEWFYCFYLTCAHICPVLKISVENEFLYCFQCHITIYSDLFEVDLLEFKICKVTLRFKTSR